MRKLSQGLYKAVTHDFVGGLLREAAKQILGSAPTHTQKKRQSSSVHNHYHVHPDKKYYKQ